MKLTKRTKILTGVTAGVIAIAVIVAVILIGGNTPAPLMDNPETGEISPSLNVVPNLPTDNPIETETTPANDESDDLTLDVGGNPESTIGNSGNNSDVVPANPPEKPIEPQNPIPPANNNNSGGTANAGDSMQTGKYTCGTANHHCDTAEKHAFISNLEIDGCDICNSHSCPSFYALNPWGYTQYTPSKCPKYDITKDPVHFCQDCGKPTGDGTNETCEKYINATNCPNCDEYVPSQTCHTCKSEIIPNEIPGE